MNVWMAVLLLLAAVLSADAGYVRASIRRQKQDRISVWETSQDSPSDSPKKMGVSVNAPPTSFDWRTKGVVSPVRNQGQMGSPVAMAATDAIESLDAIKHGKLQDLSMSEMADCCGQNPFIGDIFSCVHRIGGLCSAGAYPKTTGQCLNNTCISQVQVEGSRYIPEGNETALQMALLESGPILVLVDASRPSFELYHSEIYRDHSCSSTRLDHALLLVGYGVEGGVKYWICKNSWGASWGEGGYIRMERGRNLCGIATMASYPY